MSPEVSLLRNFCYFT